MTTPKRYLVPLLALAGCFGTSTGNPLGDNREPDGEEGTGGLGEACRKASERELNDDEASPLGFAPRELDPLIASRSEALRWTPSRVGDYGPEHGEKTLRVAFERGNKKARYVDYEPKSGGAELATNCPDVVEIDGTLVLESSEGALNEHVATTLVARSAELARANTMVRGGNLGGSLAFTNLPDGAMIYALLVDAAFTRHGASGGLSVSIERNTGGTGGTSSEMNSGTIASWGLGPCVDGIGVPLESMVGGTSGANLLALVAQNGAARLAWSGESSTDLTLAFESSQQGICAVLEDNSFALEGRAGTLLMRGTLAATSGDGHVAARWPVVLAARPQAGAIDKLEFTLDDRVSRNEPSLERDFGLSGFDLSGYDSFGVTVRLALSTQGSWSGEIVVNGFELPDCPTTPVRDENGAMGVPGCPGATITPVARGTVSD